MFSRQIPLYTYNQIGARRFHVFLPKQLRHWVSFARIWLLHAGAYINLFQPKIENAAPIWSPYSKLQRTTTRLTCRRWRNTSSVGKMLDELEWPSLEARRKQSSLYLFHKIHRGAVLFDKNKYLLLLTVEALPDHQIVLNIVDTRHTVMSLRIPFLPELFHAGRVFLLRWSTPRPQRKLGHSSFSQKRSQKLWVFFFS